MPNFISSTFSPNRCLCSLVPLYSYACVCLIMFVMSAAPRLVDRPSWCDSCHDATTRLREPRGTGQGGGPAACASHLVCFFFVCARCFFFCWFFILSYFLPTWLASCHRSLVKTHLTPPSSSLVPSRLLLYRCCSASETGFDYRSGKNETTTKKGKPRKRKKKTK